MSTRDRSWVRHVIERFPPYVVIYAPCAPTSPAKPADPDPIGCTPSDESQDQNLGRTGLFEVARQRDVGVIAMKAFGAGRIFSVPAQEFGQPDHATEADRELARLTLARVLTDPGISGVAVGMLLPSHVDNNVRACRERQAMLDQAGALRLQGSAKRLWARLPPEYGWLRQWEQL